MGNDKNLRIGVLAADLLLLVILTLGYYFLMYRFYPGTMHSVASLPMLLTIYIGSYAVSSLFYPPIIQRRMVKGEDIVMRVLATCFIMLLLILLSTIATRPGIRFPRFFCFSSWGIFTNMLIIERLLIRRFFMYARANKRNQKNIILIGNHYTTYKLFDIFSNPVYGYNIVGTFYDGECTHEGMKQTHLGGTGDIYGWLTKNNDISEIYGNLPKEQQGLTSMISKFCDNHLIRFYYVAPIDFFNGNLSFKYIEDVPVIARREEPLQSPFNKIVKRLFDIVFSGLILILVFPWVWAIVAIIIKIQSPGPIFFLQERTGLDGRIFKCIKFRSMKVNDDADKIQATKDDPRKFPFGNLMRKLNIDELPQFINVFKGEMSVVGPRPHMLKHTEEYSRLISHFMARHLAKPGITGLAQVSGYRGETRYIEQMEGRVKKDIEYIENWTFMLDLKIIVKTVTNMFGREKGNAY